MLEVATTDYHTAGEPFRIVVEGTPDELKAQARTAEQPVPSLEDAFMHFTGHALEEEETVATLTS